MEGEEGENPTWLAVGFAHEWMPDGQSILVLRNEGEREAAEYRSLWRIEYPEGEQERLLAGISGMTGVRCSPDGQRILYLAPPIDNLWTLDLKATAFKKHLTTSDRNDYSSRA